MSETEVGLFMTYVDNLLKHINNNAKIQREFMLLMTDNPSNLGEKTKNLITHWDKNNQLLMDEISDPELVNKFGVQK